MKIGPDFWGILYYQRTTWIDSWWQEHVLNGYPCLRWTAWGKSGEKIEEKIKSIFVDNKLLKSHARCIYERWGNKESERWGTGDGNDRNAQYIPLYYPCYLGVSLPAFFRTVSSSFRLPLRCGLPLPDILALFNLFQLSMHAFFCEKNIYISLKFNVY